MLDGCVAVCACGQLFVCLSVCVCHGPQEAASGCQGCGVEVDVGCEEVLVGEGRLCWCAGGSLSRAVLSLAASAIMLLPGECSIPTLLLLLT